MSERISIREAARRLGVSDTAVHKAIKAGRVTIAGRTASDRPLLAWPDVERDWKRNSDPMKRSHVGSRGGVRRFGEVPMVELPTSSTGGAGVGAPAPQDEAVDAPELDGDKAPDYAQSRAIRERYMARLAKLEFDQKSGKLVSADDVKAAWFHITTTVKTKVLALSSRCKAKIPSLTTEQVAIIDAIAREALEELAERR